MNQNSDDKLEKILAELNKVLDELTKGKKTVVDKKLQDIEEQCEQRIKEIKENLKSVVEEEVKSIEEIEQKQIFSKTTHTPGVIEKKEEETVETKENVVPGIEPVPQPVIPTSAVQKTQTEQLLNSVPAGQSSIPLSSETVNRDLQQTKISGGGILINTVFIYPSAVSDSKNLFFDNINSTFTRMSKTQIKLVPSLCIEYNSIEDDLLTQIDSLIEKIRDLDINALFCVITEALSTEQRIEEFMNKVSPNVIFAKTISFSELKMKSFYLDVAIDLLLTIPQGGKV